MSVVDIHPEELIDRLEAGTLSPVERTRLDAHLAACEVCRFELALRADVAVDARRAGVGASSAPSTATRRASRVSLRPPLLRRLRRWATGGVLAAALLVMAAASLAAYAVRTAWSRRSSADLPAADASVHAPRAAERVQKRVRGVGAVASDASATPEPTLSAMPLEALAPPRSSGPEPAASSKGFLGASASALFSEANAARRAGDVARATELYRKLEHRYPESQEAILSHLILGRLLLSHDPAGALADFDAYLATGMTSMAAEAWVGRARALGLLGREVESHAAWREVLTRYPESVYADEARSTLATVRPP